MGWTIRSGCPSDAQLKQHDDRAAAREAENRRPGRSKEILQAYEVECKRRAEAAAAHLTFLKKWSQVFAKEVRRRIKYIKYELFLFFQENYAFEPEASSEDLRLQALALVCKSITKDVALFCLLMGENEPRKSEKEDLDYDLRQMMSAELLAGFCQAELKVKFGDDDVFSKPLIDIIHQNMERDLKAVMRYQRYFESALNIEIPGYLDPLTGRVLRESLRGRIDQARDELIAAKKSQNAAKGSDTEILLKYKDHYISSVAAHIVSSTPFRDSTWPLTPEQRDASKSALTTMERIEELRSQIYDMQQDTEWLQAPKCLSLVKSVFESILKDDTVKRALLDKLLNLQTGSDNLLRIAASIRNTIYLRDIYRNSYGDTSLNDKVLDSMANHLAQRGTAEQEVVLGVAVPEMATERKNEYLRLRVELLFRSNKDEVLDKQFEGKYQASLTEHAKILKQPQAQNPYIKKLFGLGVEKKERDELFDMYFMQGYF